MIRTTEEAVALDERIMYAKNEMIHSLNQQINELAKRYDRDMAEREAEIARISQALQFYADHGNWLIESENGDGYVNRIEWNASGDLWRAPWKTAEQALARPAGKPER